MDFENLRYRKPMKNIQLQIQIYETLPSEAQDTAPSERGEAKESIKSMRKMGCASCDPTVTKKECPAANGGF